MNDGSRLALTLVIAIAAAHFLLGGRGQAVWAALIGPGDPLGTMFHSREISTSKLVPGASTLAPEPGGITNG